MSKYIDLIVPVSESEEIGSSVHHGVKLALRRQGGLND